MTDTHASPYRPPLEQQQEFRPGQRALLFGGEPVVIIRKDGWGYYVRRPMEDRAVWWEGHHLTAA